MDRVPRNELMASIVLIASLLFFCGWKLIPESWNFTYLFFDNTDWSFSLNPKEYRTYSLIIVWPHLLQYAMPVMYFPLWRMLPKMELGKVDLWWCYWVWEVYKWLNQTLAFGQFPIIRYPIILSLLFLQIAFLLRKR